MAGQAHQGDSHNTYFTPTQHQQPFSPLSQPSLANQSTSTSSQTASIQNMQLRTAEAQSEAETRAQSQAQSAVDQQLHSQNQGQPQDICGKTATAQFLQNVNLVAEAARRAQMGILMRDLENISFD
ncbi:hypothetical protein FQN49_003374 [Arthroderma sp. PD_2]|nr:hypothetical protein FQN49_003374 [Arthroderma sp. PD_2]